MDELHDTHGVDDLARDVGPPTFVPLHEVERRHVARALREARGSQRIAARLLGISRWALARRIRRHGLETGTDVASLRTTRTGVRLEPRSSTPT